MGIFNKEDKFLGKECKDKITGFKGVVTGKAIYLYGCNQYCIVPRIDKEGDIKSGQWFDEGRLEKVGDGIEAKEVQVKRPGGPNRDCPKL